MPVLIPYVVTYIYMHTRGMDLEPPALLEQSIPLPAAFSWSTMCYLHCHIIILLMLLICRFMTGTLPQASPRQAPQRESRSSLPKTAGIPAARGYLCCVTSSISTSFCSGVILRLVYHWSRDPALHAAPFGCHSHLAKPRPYFLLWLYGD